MAGNPGQMDPSESTPPFIKIEPDLGSTQMQVDPMVTTPGPSGSTGSTGARPKMFSNVIVDDSPLQNQMQKNKECKWKLAEIYMYSISLVEILYKCIVCNSKINFLMLLYLNGQLTYSLHLI